MADIDGTVLCRALAAMETIELATHDGFNAYDTYPTQEEIQAGLEYPHTLHIVRGCSPRVATLGSPADVFVDWIIEAYVVTGKSINDMGASQADNVAIALDYLKGALKHRSLNGLLPAPYDGSLVVVDRSQNGFWLQDAGFFLDSDLLNMEVVGHKWLVKLTTRQTLQVDV